MKQTVYAVFLDGRFWEHCSSKGAAKRMQKTLKELFPSASVKIRRCAAP